MACYVSKGGLFLCHCWTSSLCLSSSASGCHIPASTLSMRQENTGWTGTLDLFICTDTHTHTHTHTHTVTLAHQVSLFTIYIAHSESVSDVEE